MNETIPRRVLLRAARARQRLRGAPHQGGADAKALRQQVARLRRRVADLEQEVQEARRLSGRLAELTDLVHELLVPAASRDDEQLRQRLDDYEPGH